MRYLQAKRTREYLFCGVEEKYLARLITLRRRCNSGPRDSHMPKAASFLKRLLGLKKSATSANAITEFLYFVIFLIRNRFITTFLSFTNTRDAGNKSK